MPALETRLQSELTAARKARDKPATLLQSTTLSEVRNRAIELRRDLTDEDVLEVIRRGIKKRRESIEMYEKAARPDLVDKEKAEVALLERYLPEQMSNDEIRAVVRGAIAGGAGNVGAVMGRVMPQLKGKADGSAINAIVREELAGK